MKIILRSILFMLSIILIILVMLAFFGISDQPDIAVGWTLSQDDVIRARKLLHEGAKTKPDEIGTIELSQLDLNLAANYLLNRYSKSAVKIELINNVLRFTVTMTLPKNSYGQYVNISFRLAVEKDNNLPELTKFKAGKLLLPAKFAAFIIDKVIKYSSLNEYFILATQPIKIVKIDKQKISITYYSSKESLIHAQNFLTQDSNNPELHIYQQKINDVLLRHDPAWRLSLAELLKPLFELALQRSTLENAIEQNKLVIIAANNYVNNKDNKLLAFTNSKFTSKKNYPTFLYKRIDLAQHFIASAAITSSINGQIAKAVGEEKELNDANGGSGFSFIDLAADKAGTHFGEIATSSPENALKIQKAMSEIKDYTDFMPDPRDLPEHMDKEEFNQRYQSVDSTAYKELSKQIDVRISSTPIYQIH